MVGITRCNERSPSPGPHRAGACHLSFYHCRQRGTCRASHVTIKAALIADRVKPVNHLPPLGYKYCGSAGLPSVSGPAPAGMRRHDTIIAGNRDDWTWNRSEKSHEVKLKRRKVLFHPKWSNGTAAVRGTRVLNHGKHYWEIRLSQRIFGTSMMFGIGTKNGRLHSNTFTNLLGEDSQSWGLSHKGLLWHNGKWKLYTKPFAENESTTIGLLFDWYQGTLTFYKDGVSLGVAFTGLNKIREPLYPVIASTAAKTEMTLVKTTRGFYGLQDRCRAKLLELVMETKDVEELPLPRSLQSYLKEGWR